MSKVRAKRDTSQKRQAIVAAATEVFAQQGFELASMDGIAEYAQASKRTVYNHFPSKDELFYAVVGQLLGEQETLKKINYNPKHSLEQQLTEFADAHLFLIATPTRLGIARILNSMIVRNPQKVQEIQNSIGTFEDNFLEWLHQAIKAGKLSVDDPGLAAKVFYAMIEGAFTYPALSGCLEPSAVAPLKKELIQTFLARYQLQSV
jgi:TetR/AcrR family transcriptional regulator, regulator of autoinduction and epiphytic fitness